ncbi:MAG: hypothetical protein IPN96_08640 [Anaerolineales bacterium]|nr:hypothetical protein [Anaerolineales bacterium]
MELKKTKFHSIAISKCQIINYLSRVLGLANSANKFPEHLPLVAQPVDMNIGYGMSPEIEAVIPQILERAGRVLLNGD